MQGIRTQENKNFENYWNIVQKTAKKQGCLFYCDCGEGREFFLDDMEGEDLRGWLIPIEKAKEFETEWEKDDVSDRWIDNIFWAEWSNLYGVISVEFNTY